MLHQEVNRPAALALLHANEAVVGVSVQARVFRSDYEVAIVLIVVERAERQISLEVNRGGQYFPEYEGPLLITPGAQAQTIPTQYRVLMRNIVVGPVPSNYGLITYNGRTITVS